VDHDTSPPQSASGLASWLRSLVTTGVSEIALRHAPRFALPRVYAGHAVGPDVAADLLTTLGHLRTGGVTDVANVAIDDAIQTVLTGVDGARTHTFFSYRIAETLFEWGPWDANSMVARLDDAARAQVALACDSSEWIPLLDERILPQNYAAVLARCELARLRLGLIDDPAAVDDLTERVRTLLSVNPGRHLDDSVHGIGRYDIYTADVWLFTEPLADRLGPLWVDGLRTAVELVERTISSDGTAVAWGRSTGSLGAALTVELAAAAIERGLGDSPERWLARSRRAAGHLPGWFTGGVVDAHRNRSPYGYRGPFRRLQLTLDLYGKLAWAANVLDDAVPAADIEAVSDAALDEPREELIRLEEGTASVWSVCGPAGTFVVPFVGATRSDYLPAPRAPGTYEVPVDSELACWAPVAAVGDERHTVSGRPIRVEHRLGSDRESSRVVAVWDGLRCGSDLDVEHGPASLPGSVSGSWWTEGRSLCVSWDVSIDDGPTAMWWSIPERRDRPLVVEWTAGPGTTGRADTVVVDGISEWRSFWSEASLVHQFDVEPSTRTQVTMRVTPALRVASTAHGHHYDRSLTAAMGRHVAGSASPWGPLGDRSVDPQAVDLFHLHWPEWLAFDDIDAHRSIVNDLADRSIPVVWTAHNITPHEPTPTGTPQSAYEPAYQLWADAADAVIHHTHGGRDRFTARYGRGRARHVVLPHGDFSSLWSDLLVDRRTAEAALDLPPARIRIGLLGAPRTEKLVEEFLEGVRRSRRGDISVVSWSERSLESVPGGHEPAGAHMDPRIAVAEPYQMVDEATYALRLSACDALAFPFDPDGEMQATGTVADAIAAGIPGLCSTWWYLHESLGDAAITVGHRAEEVATALDALDDDTFEAARNAAVARRDHTRWSDVAARTLTLYEEVLTACWR